MDMQSAPAIRGISKRTEQQGNVIVAVGFPDAENDGDLRVECENFAISEVGVGIERQAVSALDERALRQEIADAPVLVGLAAAQLLPSGAQVFDLEDHGNSRGGLSDGDIQDVRGDGA